MSKSIEFIKKRIVEGGTHGIDLDSYENIAELSWKQFQENPLVDAMLKNKTEGAINLVLEGMLEDEKHDFKIEMRLSPNEDFDYFTMESCICDGTLLFHYELVERILQKIAYLGTYATNKMPKDYLNNPERYLNRYLIGNPVICTDVKNEYAPQDKPWMTEKVTVFVPIKNDFE